MQQITKNRRFFWCTKTFFTSSTNYWERNSIGDVNEIL